MFILGNSKKVINQFGIVVIVPIGILFLVIDAASRNLGNIFSLYLKYSTIILCFILSLLIGSDGYSAKDKTLVQIARFFTVIADYFLVIINNIEYGILCFCIVQIIYIIRHNRIIGVEVYKLILLVFTNIVILIAPLNKTNLIDYKKTLLSEGAVYGGILLCSLYVALKTKKKIIAAGMLLFFLCDINVALYNLTGEFIFGFLIWMFYLPSQLLLTLSGFRSG